ncbi:hypothetical protein FAM09_26165 [Niastella caeni]|uniref:Glycosyltransferase RgtA/B/C/D-like domain-containing protein n=1 Tax=Niastella caeni TaxID=2569763 RepID=A0A4S8HDD6_9BACT|nr:hypothetical protein [Niastella caeni]THU32937.1 hypothetical protein FAM09_26165 [Niastella caeni]
MTLLQLSTLPEKWLGKFAKLSWWKQWGITSVLALVLYWPILGNSFVADDFIVLKKVCLDKKLNTDGFFRPLSDITLYINFMVNGFQPAGYYLWNILIHALDTVLLFHFCLLWKWTYNEYKQLITAGLGALLFLSYPFHSEPVVWVLGRAALMGNTFGMLALVCMVSNRATYQKMAGVAICYFIGMTGYESVIVLPAMVFVWLQSTSAPIKKQLAWMGCMLFTFLLHVVVRVNVSGTVTGDYGTSFFKVSVLDILAKSAKSLERLFLPPMEDDRVIVALFSMLVILIGVVLYRLWKKMEGNRKELFFFLQMLGLLFIALLIPFLFGVSTHTSESDRFLHFPSFFFCILVSFCLVNLLHNKRSFAVIVSGIVIYNICFLETTNYNWTRASRAVSTLLQIAHDQAGKGKLYIVNLPDEINGAYIFRSGLPQALILHKLDTASVRIVNQVKRDSLLVLPETIQPRAEKSWVFIPPRVVVNRSTTPPVTDKKAVITISPLPADLTVYWNNKKWVTL